MALETFSGILKVLEKKYRAFSARLGEAFAVGRWEAAVGAPIAKHARVVRVQDRVLFVEVDHPIWKTELHHRKRQILDILNATDSREAAGDAQAASPDMRIEDIFFVDPRPGRWRSDGPGTQNPKNRKH